MKTLKLFYLIVAGTLFSCYNNKSTFDRDRFISKYGQPSKIEYFKHINQQVFKYDTIPTFTILNKEEIEDALTEIKNANHPEPWKGGGWDRIVLTFNDTIIKINTNKKRIGLKSSGLFYDLDKNNFITKRLNEK